MHTRKTPDHLRGHWKKGGMICMDDFTAVDGA